MGWLCKSSWDRSNVYPESKPSDSSREISKSLYYECRVRGSFCEISEEYDVKTTLAVHAVVARWQWLILILASRVCINSRPSRRPSMNQNGSVQLGEKAAEYFLGCALIWDLQGNHQLNLQIRWLCTAIGTAGSLTPLYALEGAWFRELHVHITSLCTLSSDVILLYAIYTYQ